MWKLFCLVGSHLEFRSVVFKRQSFWGGKNGAQLEQISQPAAWTTVVVYRKQREFKGNANASSIFCIQWHCEKLVHISTHIVCSLQFMTLSALDSELWQYRMIAPCLSTFVVSVAEQRGPNVHRVSALLSYSPKPQHHT